MYGLLREGLRRERRVSAGSARTARSGSPVSPTVLALGFTSLFTDISSESTNSILPLYLLVVLRLSPISFGLVDGIYQGASALLSIAGGIAADRWRRYKLIAGCGYVLSLVARIGLVLVGGAWGLITGALLVDRLGKGLRTAPRDAMIALSSHPEALGLAFGVHRALDTLGALLGPILAFVILREVPGGFDVVFVASCCAAVLGLGVLLSFVDGRESAGKGAARESSVSIKSVPTTGRATPRTALALIASPKFAFVLAVTLLVGASTISDSFLYVVLQRRLQFGLGLFPLLYVGTSLAYFILAIPAGMLADRLGAGRVFFGGYVLLLGVYTALLRGSLGTGEVFVYLALFGAYYAATDGVLSAMASSMLQAEVRASGLAMLGTGKALAGFGGSVLFGLIWIWRGEHQAVLIFTISLATVLLLAGYPLVRGSFATFQAKNEVSSDRAQAA